MRDSRRSAVSPTRVVSLLLTGILTIIPWASSQVRQETDLCMGLQADDLVDRPMGPLHKPLPGAAYIDPQFGTKIRRITNQPDEEGDSATRPMYSTIQAWNADESLLILYQVGSGHRLYDGMTYEFIRELNDIAPVDLEQVFWGTTDPSALYYPSRMPDGIGRLYRYNVVTGDKEVIETFDCPPWAFDGVGNAPMALSWDSSKIGLRCDDEKLLYDIAERAITGSALMPDVYAAPVPTASGSEYLIEGWLVDEEFDFLFELDLAKVYEHSSLGQKTNGNQTYNAVSFAQGPLGSGIGTLVSHDLTTGSSEVIVGPSTGYPYPPSTTHVSSISHLNPGWAAVSVVGDPAGQTLLNQEILLGDLDTGRVCRAAHHRSSGRNNEHLDTPYWAEPHVTISPSGTRLLYASDWNGGATIDTYVIELPTFTPPSPELVLTISTDKKLHELGEDLLGTLSVDNGGIDEVVDGYLLIAHPDRESVTVYTSWSGPGYPSQLQQPADWDPIVTGADLAHSSRGTYRDLFQTEISQSAPPGTHALVFLVVRTGSLADNILDPEDIVGVTWAPFSI